MERWKRLNGKVRKERGGKKIKKKKEDGLEERKIKKKREKQLGWSRKVIGKMKRRE